MSAPATHLWAYGQASDSFMSDPTRKCKDHPGLWFSYEVDDLAWIRQYACGKCPVFEQCARYGIAHPEEAGIFAGYTEHERQRIASGKKRFKDWRQTWTTATYAAVLARMKERRERARGTGKRARRKNEQGLQAVPRQDP